MAIKKDQTVWGVHGGRTGDADSLFLKNNVIALGWVKMGDLSKIPADRESFKIQLAEKYPDKKPGAIPVDAGQLYRFVHEVQIGNFVVYPSKVDHKIHIGKIESLYKYQEKPEPNYPHQRPVIWTKAIPRTQFSQGALYEIGSAMSFFQVKTYAEEFISAIEGKTEAPNAAEDKTIALVAEEIEQTTRDFILKRLAQELKGHPFADFVAHLLGAMGYRTRISAEGIDGGVDIIAHKDELGFEPPIIKVQVKSSEGTIGDPIASALYGKVGQNEFGLLITLGTFSNQANGFAREKSNLRLVDGEELVDLILQHYDQFDARYKGLIPLKRVYIPEPIEEISE